MLSCASPLPHTITLFQMSSQSQRFPPALHRKPLQIGRGVRGPLTKTGQICLMLRQVGVFWLLSDEEAVKSHRRQTSR